MLVRPAVASVVVLLHAVVLPVDAAPPPAAVAPAAGKATLEGTWTGEIKVPGSPLKFSVRFTGAPGGVTGALDIPAQGAKGLAVGDISLVGETVRFGIEGVPGDPTFEGALAGDRISGTFTQGGTPLPFEMTRGAAATKSRPQDPKPPFPYTVEEVMVPSEGGVTLAGTLTMPRGEGPFPAAVMITGSGPQNRDEEIFDHRPFAVWADALTRAGVAVLRCDDRGVGASTGSRAKMTMADIAADAEAAVRFLKGRDGIGPIGLIGHSEGAEVGPMVAARNPDVAWLVLLAGGGVDGKSLMVEQNRMLFSTGAAKDDPGDAVATAAEAFFGAILDGAPEATLRERAAALIRAQSGGAISGADLDEEVSKAVAGARNPALVELLRHDPRPALRRVKVPVLALNGAKDKQVSAKQNLPEIERALREAGNRDVTVKAMPGLNHAFQRCKTGDVAEYGEIEETVNPAVLATVREWILKRFGPRRSR